MTTYGKYGLPQLDEFAVEALARCIMEGTRDQLCHALAAFLIRAQIGGDDIRPQGRDADAIERAARAIAAHKRGIAADDPVVDNVWRSYIGQARAALASVDTHPTGGDGEATAPFMSGAVPNEDSADAQPSPGEQS